MDCTNFPPSRKSINGSIAAMMRRPLSKFFSMTQASYSAICSRGMKFEPAHTQLRAPQAKNSSAWSSQPHEMPIFGNAAASMCSCAVWPELSLIATKLLEAAETVLKNSRPIDTLIRPG